MRPAAVLRRVGARVAGPVLHRLAVVAGGPPPGLRRGAGVAPRDVPVLLVLVGPDAAARAEPVLEGVRAAQHREDRMTPVLCLEEPELALYRRAGYVVELVRDGRPPLRELEATYATRSVVRLEGLGSADEVERAVRTAAPHRPTGPVEGLRRALRRLEAMLDR